MEKEKKPRAPRKKKTDTPIAETSVVSAFGGSVVPALFVEEIEHVAPAPAKRMARKPPVVASVTPDGIQGSLTPAGEMRPLIVHLPIRSSDIENDLFASMSHTTGDGANGPTPFDPEDQFANYGQSAAAAAAAPATPAAAEAPVEVAAAIATRPSLPLHYSEKLMVRFQDANRDQRLPDSTDVACFWDCHSFRGPPCVIPTVIEEGIWRVYGNFCCPECAAAYLFNERLDSHVQWERYAMLNRLYSSDGTPVRLAAARTILRLFGGSMDISDYRTMVAEKRMRVDVMSPPMISIIQVMDTKPIDFYDASMKNTFIPWEMDRMNRPGAQGLRLRRTKPVSAKESTLEFCMGIVS
jgi:hypothetical protein